MVLGLQAAMTVRLVGVLKGLGDRFLPGLQMKALGCAGQFCRGDRSP